MIKGKGLLALALAILLAVTNMTFGMEVQAEETSVEGDYEYSVNKDGNSVTILKYNGDGEEVIIPEKINGKAVAGIEDTAFLSYEKLKNVLIPKSVTYIGINPFEGCTNLEEIQVETGNVKYDSREGCNAVIETASGTLISGCKNTVIPESVSTIGDCAFGGCKELKSIIIPESVINISWEAFDSCSGLTKLKIPSSVKKIGDEAFSGCDGLESIIVDTENKTYDSRENCNGIINTASNTLVFGCKNTIIPQSVTSIGAGAFFACRSLTKMSIPGNVTVIEECAFSLCEGLEEIIISEGVTEIRMEAFNTCRNLRSVQVPSSITSIGDSAFAFCSSLTSIKIPAAVRSIGNGAFTACVSLGTISVDSGNKTYDSRGNCNAVIDTASNTLISGCKNTVIPASVIKIGKGAFTSCRSLTSIAIPSSVKSIEEDAFSWCIGLTSVTIPNSVTMIGEDAFSFCSENLVITGNSGTEAEAYARKNGIKFRSLGQSLVCKKKEYTVTYGGRPFKIDVSSSQKPVFESSAPKIVSVDKNTGTATIKGTGTAVITVRSGAASVKVTVKVNPKKQKIKSVKAAKGKKLVLKWEKDKLASGYQVQLSTVKNFKKVAKKYQGKKNVCTFTKLKAGKKYYIRIRSYKKSGKDTLYGAWSSIKRSSKIKK